MSFLFNFQIKHFFSTLGWLGLLLLFVPLSSSITVPIDTLWTSIGLMSLGVIGYSWTEYRNQLPGIKNNGIFTKSLSARGLWGWGVGLLLTAFYIAIYFYPEILGYRSDGKQCGCGCHIRSFESRTQRKPCHTMVSLRDAIHARYPSFWC